MMLPLGNFLKMVNDASVVIKTFIAAVLLFYFISLMPSVYPVLAITPFLLLPPNFRVWTFATGLIVEASIVNVLADIPILIACGWYIEPLWGALELLKYISITGIGTALMTSFVSLAAYSWSQNSSLWFVNFSGMAGVVGGLSVAFKQIMPDQKINLKYKVFYVNEVPFLCVLLYSFLSIVHLIPYTQSVMTVCGLLVGWTYLRFYQPHGKGMRGDMSANFDFASMLPPFIRPPVRMMSNAVHQALVKFGVCSNPVKTYDVGAPSSITISLPGSDPVDAERRRKKALRALNERLVQMKTKSSPSTEGGWPAFETNNAETSMTDLMDDEQNQNVVVDMDVAENSPTSSTENMNSNLK